MAEFLVHLDGQTIPFESDLHHLDALKSVTEKIERGELSDPQAVAIFEEYQIRRGLTHQECWWFHYFATSPMVPKKSCA
jgi:hypothetical protein